MTEADAGDAPEMDAPHKGGSDTEAPAENPVRAIARNMPHWTTPEVDERRLQNRELADVMRRIIDELVQTDAPYEDLKAATETASAFADRLAALPRRRSYEGFAEASMSGDARAFFDHSPILGKSNPVAPPLHITEVNPDTDPPSIEARVTMTWPYEGPPAHTHGGWVAALWDEVLGGVQALGGNPGFTGTLTVVYRSPTPLGTELVFRGWVDSVSGRKTIAKGTCHAGETLCSEAEGIFIAARPGRFLELVEQRRERASED